MNDPANNSMLMAMDKIDNKEKNNLSARGRKTGRISKTIIKE